ncbi:hypothetical protein FRIG_07210 [Frigoribacterium faeni]|uniref:hypothetical protein n=1 Tax=Frigoribacterium faeni TaxID=145483 RepID=UPI001FAE544B|nr:hypothetical protein [Frigoribacterium faeni]MCJ0700919.1 hypothetical protein [Frigoribacterium faeni]
MIQPNWAEGVTAVAAALVPVTVLILGIFFSYRQSRSEELTRVRLEYYKELAPKLNRIMCYMLFIGTWRDESPEGIIRLKRQIDTTFHSSAPLFSKATEMAYKKIMDATFTTYGAWGSDARIRSSAYRRKEAWRGEKSWDDGWNYYFVVDDSEAITPEWFDRYRDSYDSLLAQMVVDLGLGRRRHGYTTKTVSLNAHDKR